MYKMSDRTAQRADAKKFREFLRAQSLAKTPTQIRAANDLLKELTKARAPLLEFSPPPKPSIDRDLSLLRTKLASRLSSRPASAPLASPKRTAEKSMVQQLKTLQLERDQAVLKLAEYKKHHNYEMTAEEDRIYDLYHKKPENAEEELAQILSATERFAEEPKEAPVLPQLPYNPPFLPTSPAKVPIGSSELSLDGKGYFDDCYVRGMGRGIPLSGSTRPW